MGVYRPLRAGLFFYEASRLLLLAVSLFLVPAESSVDGALFPYFVFLSSNALFPLMVLFVWLRPEEHSNYLNLYIAGKVITVVMFYLWEIFIVRQFPAGGNAVLNLLFLGGSVLLSFLDILSVWGAWMLRKKILSLQAAAAEPAEIGGI